MSARDPLTEPWDDARVAVVHRLAEWAVAYAEVNRSLGAWTGLAPSDAVALSHVVWAAEGGDPLSPAALARRVGLTSGATSLLVDRLETGGWVARSREHADRRRVTVRPTQHGRDRVRAFVAEAGVEVAEVLRGADEGELAATAAFLVRLTAAHEQALARLAAGRRPGVSDR